MKFRQVSIGMIVFSLSTTVQAEDQLAKSVTALVQPRIERGESIGIVVGVVRGDQTDVFGFGRPSLDDDQPPDGRTLFEIGSITKVFTAMTLAEMVQAKRVSLDEPVQSLLPDSVIIPQYKGRPITLRHLASHTSGLPRIIPKVIARSLAGQDPYANVSLEDMADYLKTFKLLDEPGAKYAYSNLGSGLLGTALARRANLSYEELILSTICRPLGMNDTSVTIDPTKALRLAKPYTSDGKPTKPWSFESFAGAGALRSSVDDMLRFVRANLKITPAPESLRTAMETMLIPRTSTDSTDMSIALGWHILRSKQKSLEIIWHNGGTGGFRSFVGFVREKKLGVVVLSNSDASIDDVGFQLIDRFLHD